jgi:hypothetical protein
MKRDVPRSIRRKMGIIVKTSRMGAHCVGEKINSGIR